jgi:hypothetical protein
VRLSWSTSKSTFISDAYEGLALARKLSRIISSCFLTVGAPR